MWQELIPKKVGEGGGDAGKDADEAGFEGVYGAFGSVTVIDVGGNKLVYAPLLPSCG